MTHRMISALLATCLFLWLPQAAYAQSVGASCTAAQAAAANAACNVNACYVCTNNAGVYTWVQQPLNLGTAAAAAGSSCTTYPAGALRYNSTLSNLEYCNGSVWTQMVVNSNSYSTTAPSGSGYFVVSAGTYNGNFAGYAASGSQAGLAGADAICLTELTTNTGWKGYSTANSNGLLTASNVHAFICVYASYGNCENLMPNTTYYFANAGNSNAGGAGFTTDGNGAGPYDSADWSAANYFSGLYEYWSGGRGSTSATVWGTARTGGLGGCNYNFSSSSSSSSEAYGITSGTDGSRWNQAAEGCNSALNLICFVNP